YAGNGGRIWQGHGTVARVHGPPDTRAGPRVDDRTVEGEGASVDRRCWQRAADPGVHAVRAAGRVSDRLRHPASVLADRPRRRFGVDGLGDDDASPKL